MNMDGAFLFGGRYNTPEIFGALYLSDSSEGCATEMKRRPDTPRDYLIGEIKVTVSKICDLTDTALLEQLGINPDELCRDEWELTQELGELIREAGFEGAVVPSAAGPYRNLVLFPDCFSSKSSIELKDVHPLFINDKQD